MSASRGTRQMGLQYEPDNLMPHFTIQGKFPSLNEYLAACGRNPHVGAKLKREYMMLVVNAIRRQVDRHYKASKPLIVHFRYFEPTRRRDKDNIDSLCRKYVFDGLQVAGIIDNDGWDEIENYTHDFFVDKKNPRIEVYLEEVM